MIVGCVVKPILIIKISDYTWTNVWSVFKPCIIVTMVCIPLPLALSNVVDCNEILNFILVVITSVLSVAISVYTLGISPSVRYKLRTYIVKRLKRIPG